MKQKSKVQCPDRNKFNGSRLNGAARHGATTSQPAKKYHLAPQTSTQIISQIRTRIKKCWKTNYKTNKRVNEWGSAGSSSNIKSLERSCVSREWMNELQSGCELAHHRLASTTLVLVLAVQFFHSMLLLCSALLHAANKISEQNWPQATLHHHRWCLPRSVRRQNNQPFKTRTWSIRDYSRFCFQKRRRWGTKTTWLRRNMDEQNNNNNNEGIIMRYQTEISWLLLMFLVAARPS